MKVKMTVETVIDSPRTHSNLVLSKFVQELCQIYFIVILEHFYFITFREVCAKHITCLKY